MDTQGFAQRLKFKRLEKDLSQKQLAEAAGVDLRTIGEILGHRTIQMTMRYSHLSREHLREAAESISGKLTR